VFCLIADKTAPIVNKSKLCCHEEWKCQVSENAVFRVSSLGMSSLAMDLLGEARLLNYLLPVLCILRFYAAKENVFVQQYRLNCH